MVIFPGLPLPIGRQSNIETGVTFANEAREQEHSLLPQLEERTCHSTQLNRPEYPHCFSWRTCKRAHLYEIIL